jgi:hypothetical protein
VSDQKNAAPAGVPAQKIVTELKVSGNVMTLETGLFCIFNAPGSAIPDAASGLPGVRVSVPPGPVFRPEAVTITAFREDGWLGGWNGAALVRVTRGPAQILVTIYQAPNSTAEPPRLQILRLADAASLPPLGTGRPAGAPPAGAVQALPAPAAPLSPPKTQQTASSRALQETPGATAPAPEAKPAEIVAHVQTRGDVMTELGAWMGEPGSKNWIEGFAVSPQAMVGPGDVEYQAVLGRGWLSPWAEGGQYCGSRGMSLPILGLRMRLRGEAAERYDCVVEASFVDGTRIGPLDNGEPCQAESMAPLEAFRITLVARDAAPAPAPAKPKKSVVVAKPTAKPAAKPVFSKAPPASKVKAPGKPAVKAKPAPAKPAKSKR